MLFEAQTYPRRVRPPEVVFCCVPLSSKLAYAVAPILSCPLSGEWSGFRDCHIKPDLVLIYEKPDTDTLRLVRLGSHSELGW